MNSIGICVGASTIGLVHLATSDNLEQDGAAKAQIISAIVKPHGGDTRKTLLELLKTLPADRSYRFCATGRKFRSQISLSSISEPEAVEMASLFALPPLSEERPYRTIISVGGETFMVYHLDKEGRIRDISTGNKCASGTGEFFLQQLGRMGLAIEDLEKPEWQGLENEDPYHVSGRCSVFCKSDCTHALNKGASRRRVTAGLTRMMAKKALELLTNLPKDNMVLIGGCTANTGMVSSMREELSDLLVPESAPWFEALGAALWALEKGDELPEDPQSIFAPSQSGFASLRPLAEFKDLVDFKNSRWSKAVPEEEVYIGLDVGSTTTKGVVVRPADSAILAGEYLRTEGDPVGAARRVYAALDRQLGVPVRISGLGVTGSGRVIAGLHAGTDAVINEIIAHARAAVHFDSEVDTIFEIGGQDAKYTYIANQVPCDYAMNDACSAGTGSFLEESAKETLSVEMTDIGPLAMTGKRPPNFNDQCSAFISSDIMLAAQEGLSLEDILAGLTYSIALNYANRVKGNRPVGKKIFMQGGVCYNQAVPTAMAAITGKKIIVPPDPGLMGAYGVALETQRRIELGILAKSDKDKRFDLATLANRQTKLKEPFRCKGVGGGSGDVACDRACLVSRIEIDGRTYPFGGICNRYDNFGGRGKPGGPELNLALKREKLLFASAKPKDGEKDSRPGVGLNRSFLMNSFFPLFETFLDNLGFRVILPQKPTEKGMEKRGTALCFPGELAHGFMDSLLAEHPEVIILPQIASVPAEEKKTPSCTCVLVQGEPYYLREAFPELKKIKTLYPVLDFSKGFKSARQDFVRIGSELGAAAKDAEKAFARAIAVQEFWQKDLWDHGLAALRRFDSKQADPGGGDDSFGVVLFGRPYNSLTETANKGIPAKLATRGISVIPCDMIPVDFMGNRPGRPVEEDYNMYWGMGRMLLNTSKFVAAHPNLYGVFITNFSCGPDSFLLNYFRDIMGSKPSLTLELDNHTADAGLETRIEAFLDIIAAVRAESAKKKRLQSDKGKSIPGKSTYNPARMGKIGREVGVLNSSGDFLPLNDPRVKILIPSMNVYSSALIPASLALAGIRGEMIPPADEEVLKIGRGNSSCKECLPLQLTLGGLLHYLKTREPGEASVYLMPSTEGPCRFGQYNVLTEKLLHKREVRDVAVFSPSSVDGYAGLSTSVTIAVWRGMIIGDIFEEIRANILAGAVDPQAGLKLLDKTFLEVYEAMTQGARPLHKALESAAKALNALEMKANYHDLPKVSLIGEIYVRHDPISRQRLVERLAERGFIVRTSPVAEWVKYADWLVKAGIEGYPSLSFYIRFALKKMFERKVHKLLAPSGLYHAHIPDPEALVKLARPFISEQLTGEAILTVGSAFKEILSPACGILSIGPFGCMPTRLAEAVLSKAFTTDNLRLLRGQELQMDFLPAGGKLPFLAIETDGNPFPQVIEARLEAFLLQAERLHQAMLVRKCAG